MVWSIVYIDSDCLVIDKPAGMPSHPLRAPQGDSALEAVCELYPESRLVHRLDTGTSGLLMFARTPESYKKLREAFSKGLIEKTYIALIEGQLEKNCVIDFPIAHHPKNKAKMLAIMPKNKYFRGKPQPARTEVFILPSPLVGEGDFGLPKSGEGSCTRIGLRIQGGRRHQIRVHLATIGHPLVGDTLYGAQPITWRQGHALHADSITLLNGQKVISACKDFQNRS